MTGIVIAAVITAVIIVKKRKTKHSKASYNINGENIGINQVSINDMDNPLYSGKDTVSNHEMQ